MRGPSPPRREAKHRPWAVQLFLLAVALSKVSLPTGWWHPFTFDSTASHGRPGWDFHTVYRAGRNTLTGRSAYESADHLLDLAVPRHMPFAYLQISSYALGVALNALPASAFYWRRVGMLQVVLGTCAWASFRLTETSSRGLVAAGMWLAYSPL